MGHPTDIEVYRCVGCGRLLALPILLRRANQGKSSCSCGSMQIRGGGPIGLFEYLKCLWWSLTIRE
jgi:hypothetical protein